MNVDRPIGVFDSGFGGLSVLREIRAALPAEDLLYCADHAHLPYGERSAASVRSRGLAMGRHLVDAGCKAVVIACNTATAAAAGALRERLDVPVVGMEPAVKPAAGASRTGVIGILGTGGTLASARFAALLERHAGEREVVTRPCPELVEALELGPADPARLRAQVTDAVAPLLDAGADVLVLGCTHFPMLRDSIETAAGENVRIIDTGPAVARQLVRRLDTIGGRRGAGHAGSERFWTTGDPGAFQERLEALWGTGVALSAVSTGPSVARPG